jgi:hypothetical protein
MPTLSFGAGPVAAASWEFLVANRNDFGILANCTPSCAAVTTMTGSILQMIPLAQGQNDVAYNQMTQKAYFTLDQNGNHTDIAVLGH